LLGLGVVVLGLLGTNSGTLDWLKGLLGKITGIFTSQEKDTPSISDFKDGDEEVLHSVITDLIKYFHDRKDADGVTMSARLGTHVYEVYVKKLTTEDQTVSN